MAFIGIASQEFCPLGFSKTGLFRATERKKYYLTKPKITRGKFDAKNHRSKIS